MVLPFEPTEARLQEPMPGRAIVLIGEMGQDRHKPLLVVETSMPSSSKPVAMRTG